MQQTHVDEGRRRRYAVARYRRTVLLAFLLLKPGVRVAGRHGRNIVRAIPSRNRRLLLATADA